MKTATIRQLRNETNILLHWIERGESVTITKRRKPVAQLIPPAPEGRRPVDTPDFQARLSKSFPDGPLPFAMADLIAEERNRY